MLFYDWLGLDFLLFYVMLFSNMMIFVLFSVSFGVMLFLMLIFVSIFYKFKFKEYVKVIVLFNGLVGFIFYGYILFGIVGGMLL